MAFSSNLSDRGGGAAAAKDGGNAKDTTMIQCHSQVPVDRARRGLGVESASAKECRRDSGFGKPGGGNINHVGSADPAVADEDGSGVGHGAAGGGTCKGPKELEAKEKRKNPSADVFQEKDEGFGLDRRLVRQAPVDTLSGNSIQTCAAVPGT